MSGTLLAVGSLLSWGGFWFLLGAKHGERKTVRDLTALGERLADERNEADRALARRVARDLSDSMARR